MRFACTKSDHAIPAVTSVDMINLVHVPYLSLTTSLVDKRIVVID